MALKTNYKDDVLDISVNQNRTFVIKDENGNVLHRNITIEETTVFSTEGDNFGSRDINSTNAKVNELDTHLTANTHKFIAGYVDGEYGFYIDGVFRPFSDGTTYLGEFSANATIDISELRNPSASDFIFVINESASVNRSEANYQNYASGYSKFYPATFTVNVPASVVTL